MRMNELREAVTVLGARIEEEATHITDVLTIKGSCDLSWNVNKDERLVVKIEVKEREV